MKGTLSGRMPQMPENILILIWDIFTSGSVGYEAVTPPPLFIVSAFFFLTLFKGLRFILKTLRNALYTMCSSCIMQVFKDLREHPDMLCTSKSQRRTVHFQSAVLFECEHGMSRTSNQNAGIYKSFKIYIQLPGEYCFLFIWYMKQCTEALLITPKNKIKNNGKMKGGEVVTSQW